MLTYVLVALGAAAGAPARYLADRWVQQRFVPLFPWGTFGVNVAGSLLMGGFVASATTGHLSAAGLGLLGAGFCGGLTTFSSFGWETNRLVEDGATLLATVNVAASTTACVVAAGLSWWATSALLV